MSCDGSTAAHAANLAAQPAVAAALGGGDAAAAKANILTIHELATTRAERMLAQRGQLTGLARVQARGADAAAAEGTAAAFREIRAAGLTVPAHGDADPHHGFPLPKKAAQYGWQAVQDAVTAARQRQTLPTLAQEVLKAAQTTRRMTSLVDAGTRHFRCAECGRYRKPTDHECPATATAQSLGARMRRRLGVPAAAYPPPALDALIAAARAGDITMRHGLTGEAVRVSLDGLPGALAGGFVPDAWAQERTLALAQTSAGRVVPVLDATDLTVLPPQATALGQVAAAYGALLPAGTPVGGAAGVVLRRTQQVSATATTGVAGGQPYDMGHFLGSEFRKGGSHGSAVRAAGMAFAVGQRSADPAHFGSARDTSGATLKTDMQAGTEPLPRGGTVAVGRTLMESVGVLYDGEVVETADGQIQVYTKGRRSLLAVYDPTTNTAGDTAGATNMSAEQMAAVMAYRALHPQNAFDVALAADLTALNTGAGNPWRASDAMYIAAKNGVFANGGTVTFGAQVGTQQCPTCGRFMGDAHACPGPAQQPTTGAAGVAPGPAVASPEAVPAVAPLDEEALRATVAETVAQALAQQPGAPAAPAGPVTVDVQLDAQALGTVIGGSIAGALAQQPGAPLDAAAMGAAMAQALKDAGVGAQQPPQPLDAAAMGQALGQALTDAGVRAQMSFDPVAMGQALGQALTDAGVGQTATAQLDAQALGAVLGASLRDAVAAMPAPVVQADMSAFATALQGVLATVAGGAVPPATPAAAPADGQPAVVAAADPAVAQAMVQMAQAAQRMSEVAERIGRGGSAEEDVGPGRRRAAAQDDEPDPARSAAAPEEARRTPRAGLTRPEGLPLTAQEHILSPVTLPAPDPYLMDVDPVVGGQRAEALAEYIPDLDPNYEIGETNEKILRAMSAAIQAGQKGDAKRSFWSRAFGIYGPAGTGKNTLARQLAASIQTVDKDGNVSQGLNYVEYNVLPDSTLEDAIGTVVLEPDGNGGTRSRVKLGKLGLAAAMGSVMCINEIARNEKLATALQSILEDGEIIIGSPEAGMTRIPVHPATIPIMTWNPGNEGDPDRPAAAPLSRIIPFELPKATAKERAQRVGGFLKQFMPADAPPAASDAARDAAREQVRQTILRKDYQIPADVTVSEAELTAAVNFVTDIESLAGTGAMDRQIGLNSRTPTRPGDRQLRNFVILGKTVGFKQAAEMFRICCDQNDQFDEQWRLIQERFEAHFGADGQAPTRRGNGQAPARS